MSALQRPIIPTIVMQHVEEAASLRSTRSVLLRAPHVDLLALARHDERLRAHLDGALVAGDEGYRLAQASLETPGAGQFFVVTTLAIERRDFEQIDRLLALAEALPEATRGLSSAFGWVSAPSLRGLTAPLLQSSAPLRRWLGIAACAAHRVDPGAILGAAMRDAHPLLRVQALRTAAQVGRIDLLPELLQRLDDPDPTCRLAAAASAVLLGDRSRALRALQRSALDKESPSLPALQLGLLAVPPDTSRQIVRQLVAEGAPLRTTIRAAAWAGDVMVVPWLIKHMTDDRVARLAGEAFGFLTGANLASLDLERKGASPAEGGPNDKPQDDDVALDEDEGLPWPDAPAVQAWWQRHSDSMPMGVRCFAGAAVSEVQCMQVLKSAGQRQRCAASLILSLMRPGRPLFNIAAPAHRQQRLLGLPPK